MQIATSAQPPALLQIVREPLRPGSEAAFNAIEEDRARISATLGCPHPYLGAESLTEPKEIWWFNGYQSSTERKQVYEAYAKNAPLMAAFQKSAKPKANLTLPPIEVFASYRPDQSEGTPWLVGRGRFLVIAVTKRTGDIAGTVFEATNGTRLVVRSAETREEAEAAKASAGQETTVLAIRPSWSFPAAEWIAADPEFWRVSPAARR
ncbi:MAG TPA: hypothetical protein VH701_12225 [Vicinamibacterales bacterium]|jgi:hypothetical protein